MKHLKKIASIVLAAIMVMTMAMPVFAAEAQTTYTITINGDDEKPVAGHTYEAYQVFKGDISSLEGEENILSNIEWGDSISNSDELMLALKEDTTFTNCTSAKDVAALLTEENAERFAEIVSSYLNDTPVASGSATKNQNQVKITVNAPGYYLVKDKAPEPGQTGFSYTKYILQVVQDVEVTPKSARPTVDKQVLDEADDAENGASDGWGESADHELFENFQFKLIAKLPENNNFDSYETYKVVFHDTMTEGITFVAIDSVKLNISGKTVEIPVNSTDQPNGYEVTSPATQGEKGDQIWTLTIDDIKKFLPEGVSLSAGGSVEVIYTAYLNEKATILSPSGESQSGSNDNTVYLEYSNNPNADGEGDTGNTTPDTVFVFTYEMPNNKVGVNGQDEDSIPLAGAGFTLYKGEVVDGKEVQLIWDETLEAYRPSNSTDSEEDVSTEIFSKEEDGNFSIKGLDVGTYWLKETTTPQGYNTVDNIKIVITADPNHVESADGSKADVTVKMTINDEEAEKNTVENQKGTTLPETGGIGTTIFYVVGTILVLGAVVLLVTRKRVKSDK